MQRLHNLDELLTAYYTGHDPASEWPSEDVPRARLVPATVSTSKRRSNGSRIDSKALLGEIAVPR